MRDWARSDAKSFTSVAKVIKTSKFTSQTTEKQFDKPNVNTLDTELDVFLSLGYQPFSGIHCQ